MQTALRLNSRGNSKIKYTVGDAVAFYLPPTQAQAQSRSRKHKHLLQWAGPGHIIKALSKNGTTFRIRCGNTNYERHVLNMRKWKGATPTVPRGIIRDDSIGVGAMVAVLDLDTDKHFHIAKVMAITGTTTTLWYAATKGKVLKTAVWKFMYNSPSNWGQGFTYAKPNLLNSDDFRFTGDIPTRNVGEGLIIEANLQTHNTQTGLRVGSVSVASLNATQYKHHVIDRTWKFPGNHAVTGIRP